ncbi:NAD(P)/FAD-dependent oxidoreductase [Kineococcus sp. SYSU DK004]|uniref:NAD(P)/FAD-dependent oxidoreductase n=1 Tax=Kineococcus sp. SYSU DK004 TaxID=3383125 RepID=UPI003D7D5516
MAGQFDGQRVDGQQVGREYDVVVVGGGPAGLSAAVALARSRRSVLVVDAGEPRNATAGHAHNYLGREGVVPADLLADGRAEAVGYGAHVLDGRVVFAGPAGPPGDGDAPDAGRGFDVHVQDGPTVRARRLLITTGLTDQLPAVPGLAERWGRDVLHCPYCHGWEVRDRAIGVLAGPAGGMHQAQLFRQLSDSVTLFTHTGPALSAEQSEVLAARGIDVVDGEVVDLDVVDDRLRGVRLASGETVPLQVLVVAPFFAANADLLTDLGLAVTEMEVGDLVVATHVAADPTGATAVPGVWVAGNVANPMAQVVASAAAGLMAGAALNADLVAEDTRVALAAHRAQREVVRG